MSEHFFVPTINYSKLETKEERQALDRACRSHGFFALEHHGIDDDMRQRFFDTMSRYFAQPLESKLAQQRSADNPFGFYNRELTKNRLDNKEIFDISLHRGESTRWPDDNAFVDVTRRWHAACHEVAMTLLSAVFDNLAFSLPLSFFEDHTSFLRLNYYPKLPSQSRAGLSSEQDTVFGVSHHTDAGALTVLCQDDIASLQFELDGQWFTAPAIDGQLLINLGDMLQVWSNDDYKAPLHRVLTNQQSDRYSAPYFLNPANSCDVTPLGTQHPVYNTINWQSFRHGRASGDYADLGAEIQIRDFRI